LNYHYLYQHFGSRTIYPDAENCGPDFNDSCSNFDDGQASANVRGSGGGGGYNEDNEDWDL
jgi:hypothetical protein